MAVTTLELNFDRRLEVVTAGLPGEFSGLLQNKISREDALTIMDYMVSLNAGVNTSVNYRKDSLRKSEIADALHRWIGIYNLYRVHLTRFFKWLYSPDVEPDKRPKPPVVENIQHKRHWTSFGQAFCLRCMFSYSIFYKLPYLFP
jgi:hypothetical protein